MVASDSARQQYRDNCKWIREAGKHQMVLFYFMHDSWYDVINVKICSLH